MSTAACVRNPRTTATKNTSVFYINGLGRTHNKACCAIPTGLIATVLHN